MEHLRWHSVNHFGSADGAMGWSWWIAGVVVMASPALCAGEAVGDVEERIGRVERGLMPMAVGRGQTPEGQKIQERMGVAVIHDGQIEWARGYGVMAAGGGGKVTADTLFQAASISKTVTAMIVLRLVEQGKLKLDEPVNERLRSWKIPPTPDGWERTVTLRLLLSHRAGLTDLAGLKGTAAGEPGGTLRELLETGKWTPRPVAVTVEPGARYLYSGGGYCIIQQLVEDVTGESFAKVAKSLVFEPLGMTHSTFERLAESDGRVAVGHDSEGKALAEKWRVYSGVAAAGLWTTPSDLARLLIEVQRAVGGQTHEVLSDKSAREMVSIQGRFSGDDLKTIALINSYSVDDVSGWGLGVGLIGNPPTRFYHTGSNPGYQCEFQMYVERGEGAVVMTNAAEGWRLGREVLWSIAREYQWRGFRYEAGVLGEH
jgi:CubicO group peptidase (beta-lactamase class C family)